MQKEIMRRQKIYRVTVVEQTPETATITVDGERRFVVKRDTLLKHVPDVSALVNSLDTESRYELLKALKCDMTLRDVVGGSVVKVFVNDKELHAVIVSIGHKAGVWMVGTDRMKYVQVDWSQICPTMERVSVAMEKQPHFVTMDSMNYLNKKFGFVSA